jgi:serine/threonine protein phosphatase PrpC
MILYAKKSDTGKRREKNEDYCYIPDGSGPYGLAIVADGIGGYRGGEIASELATKVICSMIKNAGDLSDENADEVIYEAVNAANTTINDFSTDNEFFGGMGTTFVAALRVGGDMKIINIGDSRAYKYNNGSLEQVSIDHSLVQELIDARKITKQQGRQHPRRNIITKALGDEMAMPDIFDITFEKGEIILLCSDGLTDMIDDDEIAEIIKSSKYIEDAAEKLVERANEAGGYDNISCVLIQNTGEDEAHE